MTSSTDPDEIRAEIERTRAELSDNVDALTDHANPKNVARRKVEDVKESAVGAKDKVLDAVMGAKDTVTEKVGDARDTVGDKVGDARSTVGQATDKHPGEAAKQKARGNPLAAGLVAFGFGALLGSLLPASEREKQAATTLKEKAEPLQQQVTEAAKDAAQSLREPAQEAVESVKSTATDAAQTVKDEGQSQAADVKDQAKASGEEVRSTRQ